MRGIEQFLQVDAATLGALKYAGTWNASTNTPTLASGVGVQGQYYVVSVAGSTNLDGETNWQVGDWAVFNGSVWQKVDGGSTGLLTTLTVTGNTYLATTSGNVGIGTTTTTGRMSIDTGDGVVCFRNYNSAIGAGTGSALDFLDASRSSIVDGGIRATNLTLFGSGATPLTFFTNGSERARITAAGDVGIGTSSPGAKLDVRGYGGGLALRLSRDPATDILDFYQGGGVSYIDASLAGTSLAFATGGTSRMRLDSSGNLGLGVTPSAWASLYRAISQSSVNTSVYSFWDGTQPIIGMVNGGFVNSSFAWQYSVSGQAVSRYAQEGNGSHAWFTAPSGTAGNVISFTQAMTLDASGNLLVGSGVSGARLSIRDGGGNDSYFGLGANYDVYISSGSSGTHYFRKGSSSAMTLDASGNLGLGVTPSAWGSYKAVQVGQVGAMWANPSGPDVYWSANYYFGSGADRYIVNGLASYYRQNAGVHAWGVAPSGTAGNAISFTQAMTLGSDGNLAVGSASTGNARIFSYINDAALPAIVARQDGAAPIQVWQGPSGAERARLDTSGNLGIGVTPDAWGSSTALQVGPWASLSSSNAYGTRIGFNNFYNGTNDIYSLSNAATKLELGAGFFKFFTAPSGTAGNAISFTQAMTLDASGNLLVGDTSQAGVNSRGYFRQSADSDWRGVSVVSAASDQFVGGLYIDSSGNFTIAQSYLGTSSYKDIVFRAGGSERARIPSAGGMVVGTAALATNATDGFLYVPTCAGTPTGTPTTQTGTAPIVIDTTNNKLYFYSGGQWRDAGP